MATEGPTILAIRLLSLRRCDRVSDEACYDRREEETYPDAGAAVALGSAPDDVEEGFAEEEAGVVEEAEEAEDVEEAREDKDAVVDGTVLNAVALARRLDTTTSALEKSESTDDCSAALDELAAAARLDTTDAASSNCELTNDSSAASRDDEACEGLSGVVMGAAIRGVTAGRVVVRIRGDVVDVVRAAAADADLREDAALERLDEAAAADDRLELAAALLELATALLVLAAALLELALALALAALCAASAARMTAARRLEQTAATCPVDRLPLYVAATAPQSVDAPILLTSSSIASAVDWPVEPPACRATSACSRKVGSVA